MMAIHYRPKRKRGLPPTHALCSRCLSLVEALKERRWRRYNGHRVCCHCEVPATFCVVIPIGTPGVDCLKKHRPR